MNQFTSPSEALPLMIIILIGFGVFLFFLLIKAAICYFTIQSLKAVPQKHRLIEPGMVWLLMIPCFGLIWNFFVFTRVPRSFESFFLSQGVTRHGDCYRNIGLSYAIAEVCCVIPWLGVVAWFASVVLLVLVLVKFSDLKREALQLQGQLPSGPAGAPPTLGA